MNYNTEINRHTVFENAMRVLGERNDELREEVLFLRDESANKSLIINNLLELTKQKMVNKVEVNADDSRIISFSRDPDCNINNSDQSNTLFNDEETRHRKNSNIMKELKSTPIKDYQYTYFPQIDEEEDPEFLGDEVHDDGKCYVEDPHNVSITRNIDKDDKLNNNPLLQYY